jgi:mono/diheme cytochrome c family protein
MAGGATLAAALAWTAPQAAPARQSPPARPIDGPAVVTQYCLTCHNDRLKTAGLSLEAVEFSNVAAHAELLEKATRKIKVGMMPPPGAPRPDAETRAALVAWLESSLDRAAAGTRDPGRRLIHRLNRTEYANAVRDLLAVDVDASALLPPDDAAYGFDNIADALGVSPVLLERYLSAAGKVSALAVGDPQTAPEGQVFRIRQDASQDVHLEGMPLGTVGGIRAAVTLPLDGEYDFSIRLFRTNLGVVRGLEYAHQIEFTVDGIRVHVSPIGGEEDFRANLKNMTKAGDDVEARARVRVPLTAGPHVITAAFLDRGAAANPLRLQPFVRSSNDTLDTIGHPHLDTFTITGPFAPTGPGDTPSRRAIFTCRSEDDGCARQILSRLADRAYRGQSTPADLDRIMEFYTAGRKARGFEGGIQTALMRILASPKFVYRAEPDPAGDLALASRLSFFLWSSIPDEALLQDAKAGRLRTPAVLERQVRRMLADAKARALVDNFAGQWLYLRNLKNFQPNSLEFPDFDDNLRVAMQRETELFFASIMREDRAVTDLMTADYTFLNERLAKHYRIPNVYGSHFRRVTLADEARRGLLGKGAILMVTSHADRTSPVVRGKWVLDNLLNAPPPPPPPVVPPLDERANRGGKILTMRERMEEHRRNPACASCHRLMDPIGLSMEPFDAVGAWRTRDGGTYGSPIDASGELLDGTTVDGPVALRKALLKNPDLFVATVIEKLMTYGLGRGLTSSDMPQVRAIVRATKAGGHRFSSIVLGIVNSPSFLGRG